MAQGRQIDLATEADIPRILEISNWAAANTPHHFATQPEPLDQWLSAWRQTRAVHPWLVAREDGRVVGFAKSSPQHARQAYNWTAATSVYIDPAHHGRGLGTALYGALIPLLRAQGYATLLAGITVGNKPSERLHLKAGFKLCATYHRAGWKWGAWHDVAWYELHLNESNEPPSPVRPVAEVFDA